MAEACLEKTMVEACLEKTNEEFKEEGWGTTNIGFIANEGCEAVYVAVDSRTTSSEQKGFITGDESYKFLHIESCNVFATRAGDVQYSSKMLTHVEKYFRNREEIVNGIHDAAKEAKEYIKRWERECTREIFKASSILAGWGADNAPYVYQVNRYGDEAESKSISELSNGFVSGSGGSLVWEYLNHCNMKVQCSNELLQNVTRALLYATLFDECSGGYVRVFDVQKTDVEKVYDRPVLRALVDHYDYLASDLSKSLFFIFDNRHYKYTHDINVKVKKTFGRQYKGEKYVGDVVVHKGTRFVVRLVHFENPIDELYKKLRRKDSQLKRKYSQHIVPREVEDLPSIQVKIKTLGRFPILCCEATQEVVGHLERALL